MNTVRIEVVIDGQRMFCVDDVPLDGANVRIELKRASAQRASAAIDARHVPAVPMSDEDVIALAARRLERARLSSGSIEVRQPPFGLYDVVKTNRERTAGTTVIDVIAAVTRLGSISAAANSLGIAGRATVNRLAQRLTKAGWIRKSGRSENASYRLTQAAKLALDTAESCQPNFPSKKAANVDGRTTTESQRDCTAGSAMAEVDGSEDRGRQGGGCDESLPGSGEAQEARSTQGKQECDGRAREGHRSA